MEGEKMSESKNNDGREKIITQQGVFGSTFGLERIEDESCGGDGCETPKAGLCLQLYDRVIRFNPIQSCGSTIDPMVRPMTQ
ncbi:hypothetical protein MTR_8g107035 [Medicago truncatula]|uniref:Uncharacterized protein n=1 Tax=Medicago truncatula TaxID=3880 RepID=A0A072TX51_MEDTR|nr:hypothetical protein MTR_8g107035 [Medicago truncatula]